MWSRGWKQTDLTMTDDALEFHKSSSPSLPQSVAGSYLCRRLAHQKSPESAPHFVPTCTLHLRCPCSRRTRCHPEDLIKSIVNLKCIAYMVCCRKGKFDIGHQSCSWMNIVPGSRRTRCCRTGSRSFQRGGQRRAAAAGDGMFASHWSWPASNPPSRGGCTEVGYVRSNVSNPSPSECNLITEDE